MRRRVPNQDVPPLRLVALGEGKPLLATGDDKEGELAAAKSSIAPLCVAVRVPTAPYRRTPMYATILSIAPRGP